MSTEKWLEKRSVSCFLRILLNGSLPLYVTFWPWVRSAEFVTTVSQPSPQHAGWYSCWLCLLLCPPFASLSSFHSWAYLGNDLRAYFVPPQSGRFQRSHMRWLWGHHWCMKAMPGRVQSQNWQMPGQEHFLLRLKATNHLLFQDIPVEHIVNAKIRELNNKHGYYWFIALLLTFTLFVCSVKVSLDPLTVFQLRREQVHQ